MNYANERPGGFTPFSASGFRRVRTCTRACTARTHAAADRVAIPAREHTCNVTAGLMRARRPGFGRILIIPL
jgi:hypothetical protein